MAVTRFVLIGGTKRAVKTFTEILKYNNPEVEIPLCIFMPGYEDETQSCKELELLAKSNNIDYISSKRINNEILERIKEVKPHAMFGLGIWRSLIADEVLQVPQFGYIGLHGTPLPRLRGFAGMYWQILNGSPKITTRFYRLDPGIDSGPYVCDTQGNILEYSISIDNEKHLEEILEDYDLMHINANLSLIKLLVERKFTFKVQPESEATYACHRGADDAEIDWSQPTRSVFNFIRAQSFPCSGAFTYFNNEKVTIWRAAPRYDYSNYEGRIPGKIVTRCKDTGHVVILTSDGGVEIVKAEIKGSPIYSPYEIFNSIRKKCQTKLEARIEKIFSLIV